MVASIVRTDVVQITQPLLVATKRKDVDASTQNSDVARISIPKPKVPTMKVVPATHTNLDAVPTVLLVLEDLASKVNILTYYSILNFQ